MSIVTLPQSLRPAECSIEQERYDTIEQSDSTGAEAARLLGPPKWKMSLSFGDYMTLSEAGQAEAILLQLRGRVNHLAAYDPVRRVPQGTLRGSLRLAADVAAGATSMTLIGGTAGTLEAGDWLQVGSGVGTSHLAKVVANADATGTGQPVNWTDGSGNPSSWTDGSGNASTWQDPGTITVTIEPPTRGAFVKDTAVTWDHPLGYYRMQGNARWKYQHARIHKQGGFAVDLLEAFS